MEIKSGALIKVELPLSKSHIIQQNKGLIFCSIYQNLKGIFDKKKRESNKFGNKICNMVKEKLKNNGFFTSDELPSYGISEKELEKIYKETNAGKNDLIIFFAYNEMESQKTKELLDNLLKGF